MIGMQFDRGALFGWIDNDPKVIGVVSMARLVSWARSNWP